MKKTIKSVIAALAITSLFTFAACKFDKPDAENPDPTQVGTPIGEDEGAQKKQGGGNDDGDQGNTEFYTVMYNNVKVTDQLSQDDYNYVLENANITEGTDYSVNGKTITILTTDAYTKILQCMQAKYAQQ